MPGCKNLIPTRQVRIAIPRPIGHEYKYRIVDRDDELLLVDVRRISLPISKQ